jgi:hypothetical protein
MLSEQSRTVPTETRTETAGDVDAAAVKARIWWKFMGLIYRAEVAWGQSVVTVAAILRRADRVLLVRETRAEIAPHCSAGPAIRAVIGPSSR